MQEEHLLAHARPVGLPDETPSENLLDFDLDEDELRTAGERHRQAGNHWKTRVGLRVMQYGRNHAGVATRGTSRSSSDGALRDCRLRSLLQPDMAEGGTGARQRGLLGGLQGHAGQERGLGQVQGSKAEQLDGL